MHNGKMCVGIIGDELMYRIDKEFHEEAVEKIGSAPWILLIDQ